jgi:hypothetical protein
MAFRNLEARKTCEPALSRVGQLFSGSWEEEDGVLADDSFPP